MSDIYVVGPGLVYDPDIEIHNLDNDEPPHYGGYRPMTDYDREMFEEQYWRDHPHTPTTKTVREIVDLELSRHLDDDEMAELDRDGYSDADRVLTLGSLAHGFSEALGSCTCPSFEDWDSECEVHGKAALAEQLKEICAYVEADITDAMAAILAGIEALG